MAIQEPVRVTDTIIRVRTFTETAAVSLHAVLAAAHSGDLIDLPGMRADQRAPVVTALAILGHLLQRYAPSPLRTTEEWQSADAHARRTMRIES